MFRCRVLGISLTGIVFTLAAIVASLLADKERIARGEHKKPKENRKHTEKTPHYACSKVTGQSHRVIRFFVRGHRIDRCGGAKRAKHKTSPAFRVSRRFLSIQVAGTVKEVLVSQSLKRQKRVKLRQREQVPFADSLVAGTTTLLCRRCQSVLHAQMALVTTAKSLPRGVKPVRQSEGKQAHRGSSGTTLNISLALKLLPRCAKLNRLCKRPHEPIPYRSTRTREATWPPFPDSPDATSKERRSRML